MISMTNLYKSKKLVFFAIALALILMLAILYSLFIYDIGFNSTKFVTNDFNKIFNYRSSGNCDEFGRYVIQDHAKNWFERCLEEKERNDKVPIKHFSIINITTSGDKAFLQVEIVRDNPLDQDKELKYSVNYQMIKVPKKWFLFFPKTEYIIDQGLN